MKKDGKVSQVKEQRIKEISEKRGGGGESREFMWKIGK